MSRLLGAISAVWLNARIVHLEWALREMDPLHRDLPAALRELVHLRDLRAAS